MKRKSKKVIIIILFLIAVITIAFLIYINRPLPAPERIVTLFETYEEDYTKIAQIYYNDYLTREEDKVAYSTAESGEITCRLQDTDLKKIALTEDETASARRIDDTFSLDGYYWDRVYVYEGFVSFSTVTGHVSLVYSVDGSKPTRINFPDDGFEYIVSDAKITEHWYYMSGQ